MGGSPWLTPSKKAHRRLLSITGVVTTLVFPILGDDLCSCTFCTSRTKEISMGVHIFLKIALFHASHMVNTNNTGKALNSHTALLFHQSLVSCSHVPSKLIILPWQIAFEASVHNWPAYGHVPKIWEVSSSFLHKMQNPGPWKPLFLKFSQVNSLLFIASQNVRMVFNGLFESQSPCHHHDFSPSNCSKIATSYPFLVV